MAINTLEVRATINDELIEPVEAKYIGGDRFEFTFRTSDNKLVKSVLNAVGLVQCVNLSMKVLNEYPTQALLSL